jgi:ABC-2 type transport system ATP-binding protein
LDPRTHEAEVKARLAYVPDFVAFYPWMTVRDALEYQASFRERWNRGLEESLLRQFGLDLKAPVSGLSKGQRTQLALIGAIAAEPELLILDEPTSGLDPLVRREFIQTVIGAYQDAVPGRTVFVSTHLITEFEGLIDRFTVLDHGRSVLTADADEARSGYRRVRAEFTGEPPHESEFKGVRSFRRVGKSLELVVNGEGDRVLQQVRQSGPVRLEVESLTLEEIFLAVLN